MASQILWGEEGADSSEASDDSAAAHSPVTLLERQIRVNWLFASPPPSRYMLNVSDGCVGACVRRQM